jgi:hypothetical protein
MGNVKLSGGTGSDQAHFTETVVRGDLVANLGKGADLLGFREGWVARDISVRMGGGGGTEEWYDAQLGHNVNGDTLEIVSSRVDRDIKVQTDTRAGNNATVEISGGGDGIDEELLTIIARDVSVRGGAGNELFSLGDASIGRDLKLDTGSGDDYFYQICLVIGRNSETKLVNGSNYGKIVDVNVANRFTLNGGRGEDIVLVGTRSGSGVSAPSGSFSMGSGDDNLMLQSSVFDRLDVKMTSGNNKLYFERNRVTQRARLQGGRGYDGLTSNLAAKNVLFDWLATNFDYDYDRPDFT